MPRRTVSNSPRTREKRVDSDPTHRHLIETDPNAAQEELLVEQVRQFYALAPFGLVATFLNSLFVFFILQDAIPQRTLLVWTAVLACITLLRGVLVAKFRRSPLLPAEARSWKTLFLVGSTLSGCVWGSIGFFPFSGAFLLQEVFITFVLGGMAAGAAANLSASRRAYLLYSAPALAPLVVRFFLMGDPLHFAMGGMLALYGLILFRVSQNSYQINRTSLLLRFENRGMVEEMRSAKEHTDELNERLLAEMAATEKAKRELRVHRDLLEREVEQRTTDIVCANDQLRVEIEERKQTEQALRESERRLSHAQGLAHIG
ncbi:MAG: hypothetical protein U0411_12420, partial [Thermodesulfovibrionales bacterium]